MLTWLCVSIAVVALLCSAAYDAGARSSGKPSQRDNRQALVADWIWRAFGETTVRLRALRLLEESAEAYQAAGGDLAQAHRLLDHVYSRPVGSLAQELGGVGVTVLALASVAGLSAEAEERREVSRVLARPVAHFRARNAEKVAAGLA